LCIKGVVFMTFWQVHFDISPSYALSFSLQTLHIFLRV